MDSVNLRGREPWSKGRVAGLGALMLALGLGGLWSSSNPPSRAPIVVQREADAPRLAPALAPARAHGARVEQALGPPPVIDEVVVEKSEVCEGEENLVTVRAHALDGTDAHLRYLIGHEWGQRVPLRAYAEPNGEFPRPVISVFGKNNVMSQVEVPAYTVKRCKPESRAFITHRLLPNTTAELELQAKIIEVGVRDAPKGKPFTPASYVWSFGDGTQETTKVPRVVHSYEDRRQATLVSNFLVTVEVKGEGREALVGRAALQLHNIAFQNLAERGIVTISMKPTPRFPELGEDGVVRQSFRLFHHRDEAVNVTRLTVVRHYVETADSSPREEASPAEVLGTSQIPPGRGIDVDLELDTRAEPDVFAVTYDIEGETAEGHKAKGSFSVMRPPQRPTKDAHIPVIDPLLVTKIKRAREILGQDFVTDEDIWQLEREGKMRDFEGATAQVDVTPPISAEKPASGGARQP